MVRPNRKAGARAHAAVVGASGSQSARRVALDASCHFRHLRRRSEHRVLVGMPLEAERVGLRRRSDAGSAKASLTASSMASRRGVCAGLHVRAQMTGMAAP